MKFFPDTTGSRIFVRVGPTDMRKSIDGLAAIVSDALRMDPFKDGLFLFCNRAGTTVKLLYWDHNGFCVWHKRLERDRFFWPRSEQEALEVTPEQMGWLLSGVDFRREHRPIEFSRVT
jgi:transposase